MDLASSVKQSLVIKADDGTELLEVTFADGRWSVTGDESRYTEAAAQFVFEVRQLFGAGPSKIRLCSVCNTRCVGQWLG